MLLFRSIEILTGLLCIIGLAQYFWGNDLPLDFFLGENNRVASLLGNSTYFAGYLVLVFPLIASQALYKRSIDKPALASFLLLTAMIFLLLITQTRSSIIGLGVAGVAFFLFSLKKKNTVKSLGVLAIVIAAGMLWIFVLNPALGKRFATVFDENQHSTFARRMFFWESGMHALAASPVFGHGIGSFEQTILSYRSPDYWIVGSEDIVPHAHNEPIEVGVEYGIIGLLLCGTTIGLISYRGIFIARTAKGWEYWTAIGLTCSIIGIAIDSLANVALRQAPVTALTWLLMGFLSSATLKKEKMYQFSCRMPSADLLAIFPLVAWLVFGVFYVAHELTLCSAEVYLMNGIRNSNWICITTTSQ
ncbi:MAG: O-antigen ligase family protein, partial [bacterium]